jgi:hypothetical protein
LDTGENTGVVSGTGDGDWFNMPSSSLEITEKTYALAIESRKAHNVHSV